MREKRSFGKRSTADTIKEAKRKFFLVFEGEKTEEIYFHELRGYYNSMSRNQDIELVPIIKNYSEVNASNPLKILDRLQLNVDESRSNTWSYYTLLDAIMHCLEEEFNMSDKDKRMYYKCMLLKCEEYYTTSPDMDVSNPEKVARELIKTIPVNMNWEYVLRNLNNLLSFVSISYEHGFDKIYCIFDRDKQSFTKKQFRTAIELCRKNNFVLCISNPCFELWLLLHLVKADSLDVEALNENGKLAQRKNYVETILRKEVKKYNAKYEKSHYDARFFINRIGNAISEEKQLCENVDALIDEVGCNIGAALINDLQIEAGLDI